MNQPLTDRDIILAAAEANTRDHVAALRDEFAALRNHLAGLQHDVVSASEATDLVVEHLIDDLYSHLDEGGQQLADHLLARRTEHKAARDEALRLRQMPQQLLLKGENGDHWIVGAIDQREDSCAITLRAIGTNPFDHLDGKQFVEATRGEVLAAASEFVQDEYNAEVERRKESG